MKKLLIIAAAGLGLVAVAGLSSEPERPGHPQVYERIAASTDCAGLQSEFDQAEVNGEAAVGRGRLALAEMSTSYMGAADERMREIGCY